MVGDSRVTRFGRLLRRSSLDELPQLWNVLRGEMSLVGPRPAIPYEVEHYPPHWFARFAVKPGVTGLWQVSGRSEVTLEEMVRLDVEYARRRSLWLNRLDPGADRARGAQRAGSMVKHPGIAPQTAASAIVLLAAAAGARGELPRGARATAEDDCASAPNPIACENALPGDPRATGRSKASATPRSRASPRR